MQLIIYCIDYRIVLTFSSSHVDVVPVNCLGSSVADPKGCAFD